MVDEASISALLTEAFRDPSGVIEQVETLQPSATASERCQLLRALGNACRELRRTAEATTHHEAALSLARELGDGRLEGLAAMSLSATLTYDGEFERALALVEHSIELLEGDDRLVALSQRAGILQRAGLHHEALAAFDLALAELSAESDPSLEWDLWGNRGVLYGLLGEIDAAEHDTERALEQFEALGWDKRAADAQHNLAWLAGRRGDIVSALRHFDLAEQAYRRAEVPALAIFPDRCETLLGAGLAPEALELAERSAAGLASIGDNVDHAEALLLVARSAIAAGLHERAIASAEKASALFAAQNRIGWSSAADSLAIEARLLSGCADETDLQRALAIAETADAAGLHDVGVDARLLAADIAAARRDWEDCRTALSALDEIPVGLASRFRMEHLRALLAAADGNDRLASARCIAALDEFADLGSALAGTEMRASIATHADRLGALGLRLALEGSDPQVVFEWAERRRATALAPTTVQPPDDPELERDLNELRSALVVLDEHGRAGRTDDDARERVALGRDRVRHRVRLMPGGHEAGAVVTTAVSGLDRTESDWAVFLESGRRQYVLHVIGRDIRLVDLGSIDEIEAAALNLNGSVSLHMRALGRGLERDPAAILDAAGRLDALLFQGFEPRTDRVVVCPDGSSYGLPWGLLPTLRDTSFVVTPSVAAYRRCGNVNTSRPPGRVTAIAGPRLQFAEHEVGMVIAAHGGGTSLAGSDADAGHVKSAMAGADVAHVACHCRIEMSSPMFSSIELDDGPMFVHEFERLHPCPRVTVLSACHAGRHTSPTPGEILGLAASLLAAGSRSVVAATFAVPDSIATAAVMRVVHDSLAAGDDVGVALGRARVADPLLGGAFVCHGAP